MKIEQMKRYIKYLDKLRDSGVTNMFGARPYLMKAFKMKDKDKKTASSILAVWMESFGRSDDIDIRAQEATKNFLKRETT
jgi:hypothetical protein